MNLYDVLSSNLKTPELINLKLNDIGDEQFIHDGDKVSSDVCSLVFPVNKALEITEGTKNRFYSSSFNYCCGFICFIIFVLWILYYYVAVKPRKLP